MSRDQISVLSQWVSKIVSSLGKNGFLHDLCKLFLHSPKIKKCCDVFLVRCRSYYLLLAEKQCEFGENHDAFKTLILAQRYIVNEPLFHLKISEMYLENGEIYPAYTHLRIAERLSPGQCTIKLALFETNHAMFTEGAATMARVFNLSSSMIYRYLPIINRITTYYPQYQQALAAIQTSFDQEPN